MTRTWIGPAVWILVALGAGSFGFLSGRSQQIEATIRMLQIEAAGNLVQRIETLSLLQMGDVDGAIARLESEADGLTVSIASNPGSDQRALAYMKTYLSVVPPSQSRARALEPSLAEVATLGPSQCETALKALLIAAQSGSTRLRR